MKHLEHLEHELAALEAEDLLRVRPAPWSGRPSFCSNDYLDLGRRTVAITGESGAGASRLVSGERDLHASLEGALASWVGTEAALCFTSGYATNLGVLGALVRPGDLVVSDALNHASIIDGVRLARAEAVVTPHLDVDAVRSALRAAANRRALVAVESYYSMDADSPDLRALFEVTRETGAILLVDEAHALGVLGEGRGLCAAARVTPEVLIGTLGKALGVQGGFAAGSHVLARWLWNRARSFVFSTGMSPLVCAAARANLTEVLAADRARLARLAARLRAGLVGLGLEVLGHGHIVPWKIGASARALSIASALRARGFHVQAIRPPTVPVGSARLRLTVTAAHTEADVDDLVAAIREIV